MSERSILSYLFWPLLFTGIGLAMSFFLGLHFTDKISGGLSFLFICAVLAVLEISLSFDNAIVNANKLNTMTPVWQRRFLTWGILIAVFGMRIVFPVAVVAIAAWIGPWSAVKLAATDPDQYAHIMEEAHLSIAAFGGCFLMMVALSFFFDKEKDIHWWHAAELPMLRIAGVPGAAFVIAIAVSLAFALALSSGPREEFLYAAGLGLLTFLAVDMLGNWLDQDDDAVAKGAAQGGLGAFLYLEMLDASFSFDGVIGAFALTQNLFIIAIGLGIGAFYVRSLTLMLVERKTLTQFRYLEHGAFYSILALSVIMFSQSLVHVPELLTGLIGAVLIGWALWSSIRAAAREA